MKKEKWLVKEIDRWQAQEIVDAKTADTLRNMYQPKKSINFLMVLFSIIGSVLIGMGIVLVSANNWWYSLPIYVRTFIGFLPLLASQGILIFVYKRKMHSLAFRESAAILNLAGVFASIALVGQIFHLPGDFTNYLLTCGILSLPSMLIMDAISPLLIFYWTALNGGIYIGEEIGIVIATVLYAIGAVFALRKCGEKNSRSVYLSLITVVSGFFLILLSNLEVYFDLVISQTAFFALLLATAPRLKGAESTFEVSGRIGFVILTAIASYQGMWFGNADIHGTANLILAILLILATLIFVAMNIRAKKYNLFIFAALAMLAIRIIWAAGGLGKEEHFDVVFMVITNVILFAVSILCLLSGAKKIDLYDANVGMVTLCTLIIMRFFDSELPLSVRGVVFLVLGAGFLLFNLYLVKTKKKIKEETL